MATVYISPTGNDSTGTGTQGNPWLTISKAFTSTASGDTINCLPGTYTWVGQTFNAARNVVGFGALGSVIFDGGAAALTWSIGSSGLAFTNLVFQNATGSFGDAVFGMNNITASCSATFTNCFFNAISTPGTTNSYGIFGQLDSPPQSFVFTETFIGCTFNNCSTAAIGGSQAIAIFGDRGGPIAVTLTNCTFYSNITDATTPPIISVAFNTATSTLSITNCIVWNANGTGKTFFEGSTPPTTPVTGSNNDFLGYTGTPSLSNQLSTDPLFVDAANKNFNLRPTSPCIGAGTMI